MERLTLKAIFGKNGVLARRIKGFRQRPEQARFAHAVSEAVKAKSQLIAEAGTGTGKTFAYLIPVILAEEKTIISTGTKTLQDQLYHRDLPLLLETLKKPLKKAILKGRSNYLCHHRIHFNETRALFDDKEMVEQFFFIKENLPRFKTGDISEVGKISEEAKIWPYVTSTTDNCLGNECPYFNDCFLVQARKKAQKADLIVINHHLFFADSLLKDNGFGDILPEAKVVIFDEAHQLPEVASQFFGQRLSSHQLKLLAIDVLKEQENIALDDGELDVLANDLLSLQAEFRDTLGEHVGRQAWQSVSQTPDVKMMLTKLTDAIHALSLHLEKTAGRSQLLDNALIRINQLEEALISVTAVKDKQAIHWLETFKHSFSINTTPLDISEGFQHLLNSGTAYIYASATLSVNHEVKHYAKRLGLEKVTSMLLDSPFDFGSQALFYMPRGLPAPNESDYTARMLDSIIPLIKAFGGRTFLLFTSYRALYEAADRLQENISYPLFVQGLMTKSQLLSSFREAGNGVLLGTYSFWEGVDVKGQALSMVVIDKLPFENPACPLLQARSQAIRIKGEDPFKVFQLPQAVIALKQGLGRLIRDDKDYGVMVVCDPRLSGRGYGETFFNSLPLIPKTRNQSVVLDFISSMTEQA